VSAKHHPLFSLNTVIKIQQSRHWDRILSFLSGFTHLFSRLRYAASRHDLSDLKAAFASKDEPSLWIASFPIIQTCRCITHPLIILGSTRSKTSSPNASAALSPAESFESVADLRRKLVQLQASEHDKFRGSPLPVTPGIPVRLRSRRKEAEILGAKRMKATLTGSAFEILPLTAETQLVIGRLTTWKWDIKAQRIRNPAPASDS
jgi:hypothetical protein